MSTSLHHSRGPGALQPALDESTSATEVSGNVEFAERGDPKQTAAGDRSNFVPLRSEREGRVASPAEFAHLLPTHKTLLTPGDVARIMAGAPTTSMT